MSKLVYYIDVENPETAWTLRELMSHVALPRKTLKMPKAKDLREQEELLLLYAQGDCRLEVYKCGYFIYANSKRHTVQSNRTIKVNAMSTIQLRHSSTIIIIRF